MLLEFSTVYFGGQTPFEDMHMQNKIQSDDQSCRRETNYSQIFTGSRSTESTRNCWKDTG